MITDIEILLVEDNPATAKLTLRGFRNCLKTLIKKLYHTKSSIGALDFIFAKNAHAGSSVQSNLKLIMLDLPQGKGFEILKAIREDDQTKMIPVVMFNSSNNEKDIAEAYEKGANSYIVKPFNNEAHVETVAAVGRYWMARNEVLF